MRHFVYKILSCLYYTERLITVPIAEFEDETIALLGSELISTIWPGEYALISVCM